MWWSRLCVACNAPIRSAVWPIDVSRVFYHELITLPTSHHRSSSDGFVRWLGIIGSLFRVFAPTYAQVVCDDCMRWLERNGIVHLMLTLESKSLMTLRLHAAFSRKYAISSVGATRFLCLSLCQYSEWMQSPLARSLWTSIFRVMRVKTLRPELQAACPSHTRALAPNYYFSFLPCSDIRLIRQLTFWDVFTSLSCTNWLVCSFKLSNWESMLRPTQSAGLTMSFGLAWCWLGTVNYVITPLAVYLCVAFPSRSNLSSIVVIFSRVPDFHALGNNVPAISIAKVFSWAIL